MGVGGAPGAPPPALLGPALQLSVASLAALGTEFRGELLRDRKEAVVAALFSDFTRQCAECGLRFTISTLTQNRPLGRVRGWGEGSE